MPALMKPPSAQDWRRLTGKQRSVKGSLSGPVEFGVEKDVVPRFELGELKPLLDDVVPAVCC